MQTSAGLPIRQRVRLPDFHYSSGCVYYVTICTHLNRELFGHCRNDEVTLNDAGLIVRDEWLRTLVVRRGVSSEYFVVMPNHLHAMVSLSGHLDVNRAANQRELSRIIGGFKAAVTRQIRALRGDPWLVVWQARFYDHIVRDEKDYERIAEYIIDNPRRWCARRGG